MYIRENENCVLVFSTSVCPCVQLSPLYSSLADSEAVRFRVLSKHCWDRKQLKEFELLSFSKSAGFIFRIVETKINYWVCANFGVCITLRHDANDLDGFIARVAMHLVCHGQNPDTTEGNYCGCGNLHTSDWLFFLRYVLFLELRLVQKLYHHNDSRDRPNCPSAADSLVGTMESTEKFMRQFTWWCLQFSQSVLTAGVGLRFLVVGSQTE